MKDSTVFLRGQVWYWHDPLYGSKEESANCGVLKLDPSLRFSRYVLILQDTKSIVASVLAIPFSTSNLSEYDVAVHLPGSPPEAASYARVANIFPAHVKSLVNYVCTLSDDVMSRVEQTVLKLLVPSMLLNENKVSIETPKSNNIVSFKPKAKSKIIKTEWNEKNILKFLSLYQTKGIDVTCKEFNISKKTASCYYYNFKKKLYPNSKVRTMPTMHTLEGL